MPPGGETSRFFAPLGENAACTREASMPPLQQKRNVFGNLQTPIRQLVRHRKTARRGAGGRGQSLASGVRSLEYPSPYWTHRDTRLRVAEEMPDCCITWA